jgi:hypothetical protein
VGKAKRAHHQLATHIADRARRKAPLPTLRAFTEFDFRYNHRVGLGYSDIDRTKEAIKGIDGKRLTHHQAH